MAIPEHVRRQAMDAVSHHETAAVIRSFRDSGIEVSPEHSFTYSQPASPEVRPIPEHVRKAAMDAVSHPETRAQIRLVRDNGDISAPLGPSRQSQRVAEKISRMHDSGMGMETVQRSMTRDGFGREYE